MSFYAYVPNKEGKEPLGSENRLIIKDLKTIKGAINRCKKAFRNKPFKLFTFTNFFDDSTFNEIIV